jgi:hypothetical protein
MVALLEQARLGYLHDPAEDGAAGSHEVLLLAVLSAFLEARRLTPAANLLPPRSVPQARFHGHLVCCDNFT